MTVSRTKDRHNATRYGPPSRRRMMMEAWVVLLTVVAVSWCLVGGLWMGVRLLWTLLNL